MPRAQIKDEQMYRRVRDTGATKEKAARIANAAAATSASQAGRKGRSTMSKAQLIKALRDH